jgi:hypothetical protein
LDRRGDTLGKRGSASPMRKSLLLPLISTIYLIKKCAELLS